MLISGPKKHFGGIAQLVERLVRNEKARGSNPLTSSLRSCRRRERGCRAEAPAKADVGVDFSERTRELRLGKPAFKNGKIAVHRH